MKILLTIVGWFAIAAGLVWAAQGRGFFPYPAWSFMINDPTWTWVGLTTAAGGAIMLYIARQV